MRLVVALLAVVVVGILGYPEWDSEVVYETGDWVTYDGTNHRALYYNIDRQPRTINGPWEEIITSMNGTAVWTATRIFDEDDQTIHLQKLYQAKYDYVRNQDPETSLYAWTFVSDVGSYGQLCSRNGSFEYMLNLRERRNLQTARLYDFLKLTEYPDARNLWSQVIVGNYSRIPYARVDMVGVTNHLDYYRHSPSIGVNGTPISNGIQNVVGYFHGGYGAIHPENRLGGGFVFLTDVKSIACENNFCFFHVQSHINESGHVYILSHTGWVVFDEDNRIAAISSTIDNMADVDNITPASRPFFTPVLCAKIQSNCHGIFQQYANVSECIAFMDTLKLGSWTMAHRKTLYCKIIHTQIAGDMPEVHCPHVGPTGAGQCADVHIPDPAHPAYGPTYTTDLIDGFYLLRDSVWKNLYQEDCLNLYTGTN